MAMQQIGFPQVKSWIEKNPYQTVGLSPISLQKEVTVDLPTLQTQDGWTKQSLTPPTPLSAILMEQNNLFSSSTLGAKQEMLRDETTNLVEKAALHLKGRAWPVRRTAEGITAVGLQDYASNSWTDLGWRAVCTLRECQIVSIDETKKEIKFYPEDVRTWSREFPVYFVDKECRFLYSKPDTVNLKDWVLSKEEDKWSAEWPAPDGTLDELKNLAISVGIQMPSKPTKANLSKRIGKEQSLRAL